MNLDGVGEFIDEISRTSGRTHEDVAEELGRVAFGAATAFFGTETPLEVALESRLGIVEVWQALDVVETVTHPKCQVSVAVMRQLGEMLGAGDKFRIRIFYTADDDERKATEAKLSTIAPLPIYAPKLWDALGKALNDAVQVYFPPPRYEGGTLGHALQNGGGWMRGLSASAGALRLTIERAFLEAWTRSPTRIWVEYGFELRAATDGRIETLSISRGNNAGNVESWWRLPSDESAKPDLLEVLRMAAERLARAEKLGLSETDLLDASIRRPATGSLFAWLTTALPEKLDQHTCETRVKGKSVLLEVTSVVPPRRDLKMFGVWGLKLAIVAIDGEVAQVVDDSSALWMDKASVAALDLPGPRTKDEQRDVDTILRRFVEFLDDRLTSGAKKWTLAQARGESARELAVDLHIAAFTLCALIEQRLAHGPPGPIPVPPFDTAALRRAARLIKPAKKKREPKTKDEATMIGRFDIAGYGLVLSDGLKARPFGQASIGLVPPEGGPAVAVFSVDVWNPESRRVIDGDPFAFRRFLTWLRGGIIRGRHDKPVVFRIKREDRDEGEPGVVTMNLSDWLLFGTEDLGDRFLVDWRGQFDLVPAGSPLVDFGAIYGFTAEYLERLRTRDVPLWRRFLHDVIDPRFPCRPGDPDARG